KNFQFSVSLIFLLISHSFCTLSNRNICDPASKAFHDTFIAKIILRDGSSFCGVSTNPVSITGSVTGLFASGLKISLNGKPFDVNANSSTFAAPDLVANNSQYLLTVNATPDNTFCAIENASGVTNGDVTNVKVKCLLKSWYSFFGSTAGIENAWNVIQTSDMGYVAVGQGGSNFSLDGKSPVNPYDAGSKDMFIVKVNSIGNYEWHTFLGGAGGNEEAFSVKELSDSGLMVAGPANTTFSTLSGKSPLISFAGGGQDILVVKLDTKGQIIWWTFIGGTGNDATTSLAATRDGGAVISGSVNTAFAALGGKSPINPHSGGGFNDIFVVKLKTTGAVDWFTFLGSAAGDEVGNHTLQLKDSGYLLSSSGSITCANIGSVTPILPYNGNTDFMMVRLDSSGILKWYTYFGAIGAIQEPLSAVETSDGSLFVAGYTAENIPAYSGKSPVYPYSGSGTDSVVVKYDSNGNLLSYAFLGGTATVTDQMQSMQILDNGSLLVMGASAGTIPTLGNKTPLNAYAGGGFDGYVVKMDQSYNIDFYTFLGGTGNDTAINTFATYDSGLIIGGRSDTPISSMQGKSPILTHSGSTNDMFLVKINSEGKL
ncbi:MAG: hypothetical protein K8R21_11685, partial [Leptospira sp.]|nr:hypothetical protein [Leptospira sp.]